MKINPTHVFWFLLGLCILAFTWRVYATVTKTDTIIAPTTNESIEKVSIQPTTEKEAIVANITHEEIKGPKYTIRVGLNGARKPIPKINGDTVDDRVKKLLEDNGVGETFEIWKRYSEEYKVDYVFAVSVAWSETHLGRALATKGNITNIGNNDRGDRIHMSGYEQGIKAFYQTMNNKYLGGYNQIKYLSGEGRARAGLNGCVGRGDYCFATSKYNWESNVVNMMSALYNKQIDGEFYFRK